MLLPVGVAENEQTQFETQLIAFRHDANWSVWFDTPSIPDPACDVVLPDGVRSHILRRSKLLWQSTGRTEANTQCRPSWWSRRIAGAAMLRRNPLLMPFLRDWHRQPW